LQFNSCAELVFQVKTTRIETARILETEDESREGYVMGQSLSSKAQRGQEQLRIWISTQN